MERQTPVAAYNSNKHSLLFGFASEYMLYFYDWLTTSVIQ